MPDRNSLNLLSRLKEDRAYSALDSCGSALDSTKAVKDFSSIRVMAKGFIGEIVEQREPINKVRYYLDLRLLMGHTESDHLPLTVKADESLNPFLERILRTQARSRGGISHSLSRLLVDLTLTDVIFRGPEPGYESPCVVAALLSDITL